MKKITLALLCSASFLPTLAFAADITVDCTPPTKNTDGSSITGGAITFNLYGALQGQPKQLLTATPLATCHSVRANVNPGTQCYEATAVVAGVESDHTGEACKLIAPPKPNAPGTPTLTVSASNTTAYKLRQSVDGMAMVAIGTVTPGTACDAAQSANGYSLVPRAAVKLASKFDTLPLIVFANCS